MGLSALKRLRVTISLFFFVAILAMFFDFRNWFVAAGSGILLYPQFVPSLLACWHGAQGMVLGATGFIFVLLLTLLAGRVYCSTLCPLGTLQDIVRFTAKHQGGNADKAGKAQKRWQRGGGFTPPQNILRHTVLAVTVGLFFFGGGLVLNVLNLLDPFSSFGRIVAGLLRPVVVLVNNGMAVVLEQFGIYALAREHWAAVAFPALGVSLASLLIVVLLSVRSGRLYCNTLCPVGTLLGLVARFSLVRLQVDEDSCIHCRQCVKVCKAGCIDLAGHNLDMSRCVACYNCLAVCKTDGIRLALPLAGRARAAETKTRDGKSEVARNKREFLKSSCLSLLALSGLSRAGYAEQIPTAHIPAAKGSVVTASADQPRTIIQAKPTTVPVVRTSPISPPGSVSIARFNRICTACHLCVSACPPQVLLPSFTEYGLSGILQPRMYFPTGHCNYECTICGDVCPTGAILSLTVEEKKLTQTGIVHFIKDNCVVYTDNTACGACSEHCPTKAVNMVPYINPLNPLNPLNSINKSLNKSLTIPEVKPELCVGCGACEHACPTRPYKAIFVDGNPVHKAAQKPTVKAVEEKVDMKADFPF